jgi:hypothetical protein
MPGIEVGAQNSKEIKSLYPQRAFEHVDQIVDRIKKLETGEEPKIELGVAEKRGLLSFELSLADNLEKTYKISPRSTTFFLDYFATENGRKSLWEKTGLELNSTDPAWIKDFFLSNSELITRLSSTTQIELAGEALAHKDQFLLDRLQQTADLEGNISTQNIPVPQSVGILINPPEAREKIEGLRSLKRVFKEKYGDIEKEMDASAELKLAKKEILDIYRRRVNILIMDLFPYALLVEQKQQAVGEHRLSADEQKFLSLFKGLSDPEKNRSRLDKSIYGASSEYNEDGWKTQVPKTLLPITEEIAGLGEEAEIRKEENIRTKGLDPSKVLGEKIDVEARSDFGEEILDLCTLLSKEPRSSYDPGRTGKASDGKWQIVNLPNRKLFGLNEKKGVVLGPQKRSFNAKDTFETLGHEIEGHVLQNENKKLIDLAYFKRFGKDSRAAILSEAGAMFVQDVISQEAFDCPTIPHPHYIRAMQKKLEGGNYLDCVKIFYESRMKGIKKKLAAGKLDEQGFREEIKESLEIAITRSERLFGTETGFSSTEEFLTHSKDTAYLEQYILTKKLKEAGLEKLLFLGAGNLQDIVTILRYNLLDLNKIKIPEYQTLKIWEREKSKYMLK